MPKYRKKPVVVEAVQCKWSNMEDLMDFMEPEIRAFKAVLYDMLDGGLTAKIQTLEGIMTAADGDYIIRGVNGELYPCKPDIFEKTYEVVE